MLNLYSILKLQYIQTLDIRIFCHKNVRNRGKKKIGLAKFYQTKKKNPEVGFLKNEGSLLPAHC